MEFNATIDSLEIKHESVKEDIDEEVILQSEVPMHLFQYLPFSLNGSKLQNVCRICLNIIKETKISLLAVHNNYMLKDMLRLLSAVQVGEMYPEEDLPSNICESCLSDVIYCYEFKVKFEKSQSILQSLIKNQITKEVPLDTVKSEDGQLLIEDNSVIKDEIKEEIIFDIEEEYLEDLNDLSSGNEELCIVQNPDDCHLKPNKSTRAAVINNLKSVPPSTKKTSDKPYSCIFCSKKFDSVKQVRAHVTKRHKAKEYSHPCDQCKEVFSSEHDLHVHSSVHANGPLWNCNKCEKVFKARSKLSRHIQRHMQSKRFACDSCDKAFSELYALRRHLRVHTGEMLEKKFACQLCDKRFIENCQLTAHAAWHRGERRCVCAACGKAFASTRLLASHRLVHSDLKPYACTYCDKRFRHESTRNTHHRTHTGEKPYVCAACGKTFIQNSNLTLHMRTHTGERPYSCDKCDRKFSTGSSLKAHQRRHTGEKPYSCNVCGKRFARRDLSAHMRQHTGERPHACSACPKRFASAARLREHTRMHTGEKPFECATCTQKFSSKSHLVKHLKKHQAKKKRDKRVVMVQQMDYRAPVFKYEDKYIITDGKQLQVSELENKNDDIECETKESNITLEITPEVPLEVTRELVVQDDCNVKEILVVDNSQNDANYQSGNICINTDGVNYVNSDVNLVAVNEGTTVYHLDQSLVQIHSSGGQVTISKITSKMTANF